MLYECQKKGCGKTVRATAKVARKRGYICHSHIAEEAARARQDARAFARARK